MNFAQSSSVPRMNMNMKTNLDAHLSWFQKQNVTAENKDNFSGFTYSSKTLSTGQSVPAVSATIVQSDADGNYHDHAAPSNPARSQGGGRKRLRLSISSANTPINASMAQSISVPAHDSSSGLKRNETVSFGQNGVISGKPNESHAIVQPQVDVNGAKGKNRSKKLKRPSQASLFPAADVGATSIDTSEGESGKKNVTETAIAGKGNAILPAMSSSHSDLDKNHGSTTATTAVGSVAVPIGVGMGPMPMIQSQQQEVIDLDIDDATTAAGTGVEMGMGLHDTENDTGVSVVYGSLNDSFGSGSRSNKKVKSNPNSNSKKEKKRRNSTREYGDGGSGEFEHGQGHNSLSESVSIVIADSDDGGDFEDSYLDQLIALHDTQEPEPKNEDKDKDKVVDIDRDMDIAGDTGIGVHVHDGQDQDGQGVKFKFKLELPSEADMASMKISELKALVASNKMKFNSWLGDVECVLSSVSGSIQDVNVNDGGEVMGVEMGKEMEPIIQEQTPQITRTRTSTSRPSYNANASFTSLYPAINQPPSTSTPAPGQLPHIGISMSAPQLPPTPLASVQTTSNVSVGSNSNNHNPNQYSTPLTYAHAPPTVPGYSSSRYDSASPMIDSNHSEWRVKFDWDERSRTALNHIFGLKEFRRFQLESVNAVMSGRDVFVLLPTGGGKSLCYQLPATLSPGITIVISPLLSLIQDQVVYLNSIGIPTRCLSSQDPKEHQDVVYSELYQNPPAVKMMYVTPERMIQSGKFATLLQSLFSRGQIARFAVDEAHCISAWGHDFRKDYKELRLLKERYPGVPIIALTATATHQVRDDICRSLRITKPVVFIESFNRRNLYYEIRRKTTQKNTLEDLRSFIQTTYPNQSGIVYCFSINECETVADALRKFGLRVGTYHSKQANRNDVQERWLNGQLQVVCATVAFGMGINKANVRFVVHYTLPKTLEGYYQESGRAGRDGKPSHCLLYYNYGDRKKVEFLISSSARELGMDHRLVQIHIDNLQLVVNYCDNDVDCRRMLQLKYFGEEFDPKLCNQTCDNCRNGGQDSLVVQDIATEARDLCGIISDLHHRGCRATVGQLVGLYRGSKTKVLLRVCGSSFHQSCGNGKNMTTFTIERIVHLLVGQGMLGEKIEESVMGGSSNSYVIPGARISEVNRPGFKLNFRTRSETATINSNSGAHAHAHAGAGSSTGGKSRKTGNGKGKGKAAPVNVVEIEEEESRYWSRNQSDYGYATGSSSAAVAKPAQTSNFGSIPTMRPKMRK